MFLLITTGREKKKQLNCKQYMYRKRSHTPKIAMYMVSMTTIKEMEVAAKKIQKIKSFYPS